MKRFYTIIISIFVFVSFLYPFKGFDIDSVYFSPNFDFTQEQETVNSGYEQMICNKIKTVLTDENIVGSSVSARVTVSGEEISIDDVQIAVSDEYDKETVKQIIFDKVGINARVIHNGE